jgi:hypothetical protein
LKTSGNVIEQALPTLGKFVERHTQQITVGKCLILWAYSGDVLARRVPVSAFWRCRVSLQRKKCCQQIIGLDDEPFSIAVRIDAKEESVLGKMLGDAVRPALGV